MSPSLVLTLSGLYFPESGDGVSTNFVYNGGFLSASGAEQLEVSGTEAKACSARDKGGAFYVEDITKLNLNGMYPSIYCFCRGWRVIRRFEF